MSTPEIDRSECVGGKLTHWWQEGCTDEEWYTFYGKVSNNFVTMVLK